MVRHPRKGQNLLMTGADLLNGPKGTAVAQLSEAGQGILGAKEGTAYSKILVTRFFCEWKIKWWIYLLVLVILVPPSIDTVLVFDHPPIHLL
jgi:hypothetical protein